MLVKIVTRSKEAERDDKPQPKKIELNLKILESHFKFPLTMAADELGVSLTALKWYFLTLISKS